MPQGGKLKFKLRRNGRRAHPKYFAMGGLCVDAQYLKNPLVSILYHPPLIFVVPGFEHTVLLEAIQGLLASSVQIVPQKVVRAIGDKSVSMKIPSADLKYSIVDHFDRESLLLQSNVCFSDRIVRDVIGQFADRNETHPALDAAAHAVGIVSWTELKRNGLAHPLHDEKRGFAVI